MFHRILVAIATTFAVGTVMASQPESIPGEYVVKIKKSSQSQLKGLSLAALGRRIGGTVSEIVSAKSGLVLVKSVDKDAVFSMSANSDVEYVEPNYIYRASFTPPNDPAYEQLWGLKNSGQRIVDNDGNETTGIAGIDISAEKAWELTTGSKDVIVAVIDTGVLYNHPDLVDNAWTNTAEANGQAGVDDDHNGYIDDLHGWDFVNSDADPTDDHGHGSHVSGTIGAKGNNGKDVVGVNWNVRIMALKFLSASGSGSLADAVKAIEYASNNGAHILSNSWGGGGYTRALEDAIKLSATKGALFVAAAGNSAGNNDTTPTYPANYNVENVISVAAINSSGQKADFSCFGPRTVHVAAPGVNILSITTSGLQSWKGTSMATPHVSGIAALVKAKEPNISAVDLRARLIATAKPLPGLRGKVSSGGMADAYNALTNTQPPPDPADPANWPTVAYNLSTAHPYANAATQTYEVNVPGAVRLALHFSKFEFEANYDFVKFFDKNGVEIGAYTGVHDGDFAPVIEGDKVVVIFTSDSSVNKYGFDIDKIAVQR